MGTVRIAVARPFSSMTLSIFVLHIRYRLSWFLLMSMGELLGMRKGWSHLMFEWMYP